MVTGVDKAEAPNKACWLANGMHKATALRLAFARDRKSADRTRRVTGASKYTSSAPNQPSAESDQSDVEVLCVGDPFFTVSKHRSDGKNIILCMVDTIQVNIVLEHTAKTKERYQETSRFGKNT